MSSLSNILIIENQFYQYSYIRDSLKRNKLSYDIFPKGIADDSYDDFTDWVRVWVCDRYNDKKANDCLNKVATYIKNNDIHLIIMDVKLAGNHDGANGLQLANKLIKSVDYDIDCSVLFLSHTFRDAKEIKKELDIFSSKGGNYDWVYKGVAGDGLFDFDYFNDEGKKKITELLQKNEEQSTTKLSSEIENLISKYGLIFEDRHKIKLRKIITAISNSKSLVTEYRNRISDLKIFLDVTQNTSETNLDNYFTLNFNFNET